MTRIESSYVRSLFVFANNESLINCMSRIFTKYRYLKVLHYESTSLLNFPEMLGSFLHLKYLSFRSANVYEIPKSIGMLQNLETLDVKYSYIRELPIEIRKLKKLRHLIGTHLSLIQLKDGIGDLISLQTLRNVNLDMNGAAEVIKELGKLKQLKDLELDNFHGEDGSVLSSSINEMQQLEKLEVKAKSKNDFEFIGLDMISPLTMLRKLTLSGRFQKLPKWISELQNLILLRLVYSGLTEDPMQSLKNLQHLLILILDTGAYEGFSLHFEDGWFQKLKVLSIGYSNNLTNIIIENGGLPSLKKLELNGLREMENIPTGIQHLKRLEILSIWSKQAEFGQKNSTEDWNWIMEHVPTVEITTIG